MFGFTATQLGVASLGLALIAWGGLKLFTRSRDVYRSATMWKHKFKAIVCLVYVLSPVDLAPEAVLGPFGLADDVIAAVIGIRSWYKKADPRR